MCSGAVSIEGTAKKKKPKLVYVENKYFSVITTGTYKDTIGGRIYNSLDNIVPRTFRRALIRHHYSRRLGA